MPRIAVQQVQFFPGPRSFPPPRVLGQSDLKVLERGAPQGAHKKQPMRYFVRLNGSNGHSSLDFAEKCRRPSWASSESLPSQPEPEGS